MEKEVEKKGKELIMVFPDNLTFEQSKECALFTVRELLREHSCFTLNQDRWEFWNDVETFLNEL